MIKWHIIFIQIGVYDKSLFVTNFTTPVSLTNKIKILWRVDLYAWESKVCIYFIVRNFIYAVKFNTTERVVLISNVVLVSPWGIQVFHIYETSEVELLFQHREFILNYCYEFYKNELTTVVIYYSK